MSVEQWRSIARKILTNFPECAVTMKLTNRNIRLISDSIATFCHVQKILVAEKAQFHTKLLSEERSMKVLLRRIPSSFTELEVKEEHLEEEER